MYFYTHLFLFKGVLEEFYKYVPSTIVISDYTNSLYNYLSGTLL